MWHANKYAEKYFFKNSFWNLSHMLRKLLYDKLVWKYKHYDKTYLVKVTYFCDIHMNILEYYFFSNVFFFKFLSPADFMTLCEISIKYKRNGKSFFVAKVL